MLPPRWWTSPLRPECPEAVPKEAGVDMAGTLKEDGHQHQCKKAKTAHGPGARSRSRSPRRHPIKAGEGTTEGQAGEESCEGVWLPVPLDGCEWRGCMECQPVAKELAERIVLQAYAAGYELAARSALQQRGLMTRRHSACRSTGLWPRGGAAAARAAPRRRPTVACSNEHIAGSSLDPQ